jgi:predicted nucleotidyltransferase
VADGCARGRPAALVFGVRSLSLFGSVARDEARPDSDVDLVVDVVTAKGLKPHLCPLIKQDLVRVA